VLTSDSQAAHWPAALTSRIAVASVLLASVAVTSAITFWLYATMQAVFRTGIDERLMAVASVASTSFDPATLDRILGPEDVASDVYRQIVFRLQQIRSRAHDVRYMYILRKTDDPNVMAFVADADSLTPDVLVDLNGDGVIDEADTLTHPGDPYDVSGYPEFREAAFIRPFVDPEFTHEQWGTLLAGTAPVFAPTQPHGPTNYVIGVDLDVSEYHRLLDRVLLPFMSFIGLLLAIITCQTIALRHFWNAQVQQLETIDKQKDELLGIVSHQLAGPITAMRWQLESLIDDTSTTLDPRQKQEIAQLMGTATGLADLVSLLLDLSRVELGRLKVEKQPTELTHFFNEVLAVITLLAKEKGIRLIVHFSEELSTANIDRRLTRMTLENLLSNAVKYTPTGGNVTFTVRVHDRRLQYEVRDTGCGIPKDEQKLLFSKLFRASNVRYTINGNGFGLYIAKSAIEQQGGSIRCESEAGQGTSFFVEMPI
jgi:signal transduction histidine kinase